MLEALELRGYHPGSIVFQFVESLLTVEPWNRTTLNEALGSSWLGPVAEHMEAIDKMEDAEDDDIYM